MSNINWEKYFDAIWCINYCAYSDRKSGMKDELDRVGILAHKNFQWKHTFKSIFDSILYDITKNKLKVNDCKDLSVFNLSMAHYSCIKASYELGYEKILIMEDDVRFLRNSSSIRKYLESIPSDSDIVLFSQNPLEHQSIVSYRNKSYEKSDFKSYDFIIWDTGCYMLSRKAMHSIIIKFEQMILPFDNYTSTRVKLPELKHYYSSIPIAIQIDSKNAINGSHYYVYENMGLDLKKYGIEYSPLTSTDMRFKLIVPAYNCEKTIKRCLDSIKKQNYRNFHAVIVDDCSTDNTNKIIRNEIKGDDRFELITLKEKKYAGGARNAGIDANYDSDYTMFLDSDDYYISCYVFDEMQRIASEKNKPDCILSSFHFQKESKTVFYHTDSIGDYIAKDDFYAPWITAVRTEILPRFETGIRYDDDVVFHIKLLDTIKSIASTERIIVNYSIDGGNVSWLHNENKTYVDKEEKRKSILHNLNVLSNMKFNRREVFQAAASRYNDSQLKTL